ncbi:unnamed protein product [Calypogeia fissa]
MGHILRVLCPVKLQAGDRVLWLVGAPSLPLTILSALRCLHYDDKSSEPDFQSEADALRVLLPKGLEIVGAVCVHEDSTVEGSQIAGKCALKMQNMFRQTTDSVKGATLVVASATSGSTEIEYDLYLPGESPKLEKLEIAHDAEDIKTAVWGNVGLLRCQVELTVPLYLPIPPSLLDFKRQLGDAVDHIMGDLRSSRVVLLAKGSTAKSQKQGVVLIQAFNQLRANEVTQAGSGDLAKDSVRHSSLCSDLSQPPSFFSTPSGIQLPEPIEVTVMLQQSGIANGKVAAPVLQYLPAAETAVTVHNLKLSMAVVCMGGSGERLVDAATDLILPALRDQLGAMHKAAAKNAAHNAKVDSSKVCAYQFCPPGWLHPVMAIYDLSNGELELALVQERKELHKRLGLSLDRPILRASNALTFKAFDPNFFRSGGRRLINVHAGLAKSGVSGGRQSLIDGSYEYYHYLQDRFDDNGWGCAYRSLQTIVSWFRMQQYTTVPVPSHEDIQQTLVDIEDKEPSFVGSQEWIGAIELSFVLDKLLGLSCKILNVRTGADMPSFCRELASHFQTQGTPVMIGGGVLAYTLLGVDYNEFTGDSAFLILDPHYTGGEDLKTIRNGGWVGWKKAVTDSGRPFFLQNKFYNLLLPQRPNTV